MWILRYIKPWLTLTHKNCCKILILFLERELFINLHFAFVLELSTIFSWAGAFYQFLHLFWCKRWFYAKNSKSFAFSFQFHRSETWYIKNKVMICWVKWMFFLVDYTGEQQFRCLKYFTLFHSIRGHRYLNEKLFCSIRSSFPAFLTFLYRIFINFFTVFVHFVKTPT